MYSSLVKIYLQVFLFSLEILVKMATYVLQYVTILSRSHEPCHTHVFMEICEQCDCGDLS